MYHKIDLNRTLLFISIKMEYKYGQIYCISNDELYYVGSTIQGLRERLKGHRSSYNCFCNGNDHYRSSYEIIKTEKYKINLIENYPCDTKAQLVAREYEIIKQYKALYGDKCVNIEGVKPLQSDNEYAEKARDRAKAYYAENKVECQEKMRQSYIDNKEQRLAQVKAYRDANHDKIMEKLLTQVECECGDKIAKCNLTRHKKSQRHLNNLKK